MGHGSWTGRPSHAAPAPSALTPAPEASVLAPTEFPNLNVPPAPIRELKILLAW